MRLAAEDISCLQPAKRGDSIKPGVKRSEPQDREGEEIAAHELGDSRTLLVIFPPCSVARSARSVLFWLIILALRFRSTPGFMLPPAPRVLKE
jgi:hypothetical protein